jgi:hypothetical protein
VIARFFRDRIRQGYGNIYTPHAGSMIIQVQREGGLANRTIILSERQVRLLRVISSRAAALLAGLVAVSWVVFAVQSARVPTLTNRIVELEHDAARLDSLQSALSRLHSRYEQVRRMLSMSAGTASVVPARREASVARPQLRPSDSLPIAQD